MNNNLSEGVVKAQDLLLSIISGFEIVFPIIGILFISFGIFAIISGDRSSSHSCFIMGIFFLMVPFVFSIILQEEVLNEEIVTEQTTQSEPVNEVNDLNNLNDTTQDDDVYGEWNSDLNDVNNTSNNW
jgi:hypothetical protein